MTALTTVDELFRALLDEVVPLLAAARRDAGVIDDGHALAQAGLAGGESIVMDYLDHGEAGVALDHLLYMIQEPRLALSAGGLAKLAELTRRLEARSPVDMA